MPLFAYMESSREIIPPWICLARGTDFINPLTSMRLPFISVATPRRSWLLHLGHYISIQKPVFSVCKSLNGNLNDQTVKPILRRARCWRRNTQFRQRWKPARNTFFERQAIFSSIGRIQRGSEIRGQKHVCASRQNGFSLDGGLGYEIRLAATGIYAYQRYSRWTKHDALLPLLNICLRQGSRETSRRIRNCRQMMI